MYKSLQNLNTNKQHIYTREIEMSNNTDCLRAIYLPTRQLDSLENVKKIKKTYHAWPGIEPGPPAW